MVLAASSSSCLPVRPQLQRLPAAALRPASFINVEQSHIISIDSEILIAVRPNEFVILASPTIVEWRNNQLYGGCCIGNGNVRTEVAYRKMTGLNVWYTSHTAVAT